MKFINILSGLLAVICLASAAPADQHAAKVKSGTTTGTRQVVSVNPTQWFLATKRAADINGVTANVLTTLTTVVTLVPHQAIVVTSTDCITCITGPAETYEVHGPTGSVRSSRDASFRSKLVTETWLDCAIWVTKSDISKLGGTSAICASALASDKLVDTQIVSTPATTTSDVGAFATPPCYDIFGWINDPTCRSSYLAMESLHSLSLASRSSVSASTSFTSTSTSTSISTSNSNEATITTTHFPETTDLPDCPVIFGCMNNPVSRSSYYSKMSSKSAAAKSSTSKPCTEEPLLAHMDVIDGN